MDFALLRLRHFSLCSVVFLRDRLRNKFLLALCIEMMLMEIDKEMSIAAHRVRDHRDYDSLKIERHRCDPSAIYN